MAKKHRVNRPAASISKHGAASVRISEDLHYHATVYAAQTRRSLRNVLDEAVAEYLKNKKAA